MSRKVAHMSLEGGCLFFEDGTEVSGVSVEMIKALPELLSALRECHRVLGEHVKDHRQQGPELDACKKAWSAISKAEVSR